MLIKVCGMREAENISAVEQLGADWLGFIFWPKSSRYVGSVPAYLPTRARRVGVFVDATVDDIAQHAADYGLDAVQLHGHESPGFVGTLRRCVGGISIVKALSVKVRADVEAYKAYEGLADYFLFDTKAQLAGGNGTKFDWTLLTAYDGRTPFLLSGGIGPDDAGRVRQFSHKRCVGIDLNSRFELSPGLKDTQKLEEFIKTTRL